MRYHDPGYHLLWVWMDIVNVKNNVNVNANVFLLLSNFEFFTPCKDLISYPVFDVLKTFCLLLAVHLENGYLQANKCKWSNLILKEIIFFVFLFIINYSKFVSFIWNALALDLLYDKKCFYFLLKK